MIILLYAINISFNELSTVNIIGDMLALDFEKKIVYIMSSRNKSIKISICKNPYMPVYS
jgi:hypothetical protein